VSLIFLNPTISKQETTIMIHGDNKNEIEIHKEQPVLMVNIQSMLYGPYASRLFQFKKMKQTHNTLYYSWEKYHYAFTMLFKEDEC
jgi:hypothetical protein